YNSTRVSSLDLLYTRPTSSSYIYSPLFFFFFFFYCSAHHPHLHSFPTRRSSDLTTELPSLHLCREKLTFLRSQDLGEILAAQKRDRKSTRLNSSHVAISYAVFCLKKKK